jgi:large subunit ribosomal protein L25
MSSPRPALAAERRTVVGKAVASLRRDGRLPAVVYGHGMASVPVTLDAHDFDLLRRRVGPNALVDLSVDGTRPKAVLIHGVQFHKVSRRPIHVDLFVVRMTEEITVEVPIHGVGEPAAVARRGGTLLHPTSSVKVRARPDHLPQVFEVDLTVLSDFDAAVHVRDLPVPPGVTMLTDPDETLFKVVPPRLPEVEAPPAVEAVEVETAPATDRESAPAAERTED